jgi:hypothetical protein
MRMLVSIFITSAFLSTANLVQAAEDGSMEVIYGQTWLTSCQDSDFDGGEKYEFHFVKSTNRMVRTTVLYKDYDCKQELKRFDPTSYNFSTDLATENNVIKLTAIWPESKGREFRIGTEYAMILSNGKGRLYLSEENKIYREANGSLRKEQCIDKSLCESLKLFAK